jgi:hypothetical protein
MGRWRVNTPFPRPQFGSIVASPEPNENESNPDFRGSWRRAGNRTPLLGPGHRPPVPTAVLRTGIAGGRVRPHEVHGQWEPLSSR